MTEITAFSLFGLPRTMAVADSAATVGYLTGLWADSYGSMPGADLDADLEACRRYFDPLLRGQTLRDRLGTLPDSPALPPRTSFTLSEPVVITLDDRHRLVGVEARLVIDLLGAVVPTGGFVSISEAEVLEATSRALRIYREWASQRLRQVSDLRRGAGTETLQAKAAGLVLALLVNRSTDAERAVVPDDTSPVALGAEKAVFDGAEAFAAKIADRSERSQREHRFKGGYAVTEARRRLADLRIDSGRKQSRYYLAPGSERRVIDQLAGELAKRERLQMDQLAAAFDALVAAYRGEAKTSAWLGGVHERPAETAQLRKALLDAFGTKRATGPS